jgi:uncharacterized protein (TIGR02246 family)
MKKHTFYGLLIIVTLVFCLSIVPSATAASAEEEVLKVMTDWFKAFNTNDYELMSSLHWHSPEISYFGPSNSNAFLTRGWDQIAEVFKSLFENPVGTISNSSHDLQVMMLEDNVAIVTEYSIQTINPPLVAEQRILQLRGTQVLKEINGKWQLVHLHWSTIPTK